MNARYSDYFFHHLLESSIHDMGSFYEFCFDEFWSLQIEFSPLSEWCEEAVDDTEEILFRMSIAESCVRSRVLCSQECEFIRCGERLRKSKDSTCLWIFHVVDSFRIRDDRHDAFSERFLIIENTDKILIAFAHFPTIDSWKDPKFSRHQCFWFSENILAVCFIERAGDISCHLEMLYLVFSDRNCIDIISEYICCHEDRVVEYSHVDI